MSGKYHQLKRLSANLPVPPLTAVTEHDLASWWSNHGDIRHAIERILATISVTSAAFLDEHLDEIAAVMRPRWHPDAQQAIAARLGEVGLGLAEPLAVRSSASIEDAYDHSYAGLFVTRLNVCGIVALQQAIEDVWCSSFGRAALIERLRSGAMNSLGEMTVILQRMVSAEWAGVGFSHHPVSGEPVCTVEAVSGYGDALVSGEQRGIWAQIEDGRVSPAHDTELTELFRAVDGLVKQVVAANDGEPADIEWAFDGTRLWLLQARHITTVGATSRADGPICERIPLYAATDADIDAFKPLPDFAQYFRSKRKPLADFAAHMGLPTATALLLRANRAGLDDATCDALVREFHQPQQLLDLSPRVRQLAVSRADLVSRLRELLGPVPTTFVVRDFVRGEGGLITQVVSPAPGTEADHVLCEWSVDGLLAINRGIASTVTFMLDATGTVHTRDSAVPTTAPLMTKEQGLLLYDATRQAQANFGRVQLEWVRDGGQIYMIDYSLLDAIGTPPEEEGTRILATGYATGVPMIVDASRDLEQLSVAACVSLTDIPTPAEMGTVIAELHGRLKARNEPVIVVSPRPYAALAPLLPFAAGFLFEQASTLCHLAILLREHGVPAIESQRLYQQALTSQNQRITLSSSAFVPS